MLGLHFIWFWSLCLSDSSSSTTWGVLLQIRVKHSRFNLSKMSRGQWDWILHNLVNTDYLYWKHQIKSSPSGARSRWGLQRAGASFGNGLLSLSLHTSLQTPHQANSQVCRLKISFDIQDMKDQAGRSLPTTTDKVIFLMPVIVTGQFSEQTLWWESSLCAWERTGTNVNQN